MKFVIIIPNKYNGGPLVLKSLYKCLLALGHECVVIPRESLYIYEYKEWYKRIYYKIRIPLDYYIKRFIYRNVNKILKIKINQKENKDSILNDCKIKFWFRNREHIVVYPEIIYGNPLNATNVVRWFLYYDRYVNDSKAYGENDLFICYREQFNNWKLNPSGYRVQPSFFDLDLYKRTNYGERSGKCYIIRKGKERSDLPLGFDGIIVDDLPEIEKVKVFNSCETCISYDTQTAYSGIAAMCGCLSIVVPESGKTRNDYLSGDDKSYGVAYGFSEAEISYAKKTSYLVKDKYEKANASCIEQAKLFVSICKNYFQ